MATLQPTSGIDTLSIEGSLFTGEWLAKVSALQAQRQADADYAVRAGFNLREEIALSWRSAQALWGRFHHARHQLSVQGAGPSRQSLEHTQRFVADLLRQCLGFDLETVTTPWLHNGRSYPVTFSALGGKVPLVVSPFDEAKPLDTAHDVLGDHSGDRTRRRSAFGLLQETLNAAGDTLWGVATNGLQLRLARDNASLTRPAWLSVDLERLFTEERFADYSVLWLMLHASRFGSPGSAATECPLEQWRNACREQGTRARESLRTGVEQALLVLGQGFVSHPANTALREALTSGELSPQGYYRELLRLVYRQIFLLTVEERDILHPPGADAAAVSLYAEGYSLRRLRERAVRRSAHDRYSDLWQGLKQVWRGLATGQPALALPPLGGLFESAQCPHLDASRLENRHLLTALFHLAWIRENATAPLTRVNWRDMGPEELGSIYESLLELVPQLSDDHRRFDFQTGDATRGNARKTTGSYYTPDPLVQELLDSALEPVIATKLANVPVGQAAVDALLSISVLDPACGSGHFLLAAARRIAVHLARIRAQIREGLNGGGQPTPDDYRHALRDVVTHCIFGADLNPMALELARMALWLEAYTPDAPLGFIDHHFQLGNALLGLVNIKDLLQGIPDGAYAELTGDDKAVCRDLKRKNKTERTALERLVEAEKRGGGLGLEPDISQLAQALQEVEALPDDSLAAVAIKRQRYESASHGSDAQRLRLQQACDLYTSAFMATKSAAMAIPTTQDMVNALLGQPVDAGKKTLAQTIASSLPLLHWPLAFATVFAQGGFSLVLGNPPWERIKLQEEEFFASRSESIANARNKAERQRAIDRLATQPAGSPERRLFDEFVAAKHLAEASSTYCHGPRYPLTGTGDVNTYALFAETALQLLHQQGRAGLVLPSGIATDDSTKAFFGEISKGRISQLVDFENREGIFPAVDSRMKFCLLSIGAAPSARFAFFLTNTAQLQDHRRSFTLSADDIARLNPNTRTAPVFRSQKDAEITKGIYERVPVFWDENKADGNPWGIRFMTMFHMSNDSHLFRDARRRHELANPVALYEAKMIHQFDHRWATYVGDSDDSRDMTDEEKADPSKIVQPRYWVENQEVDQRLAEKEWRRKWLLGFRDITNTTNERTCIAAVIPRIGCGNKFPLLLLEEQRASLAACLIAGLSSLCLDYVARQKLGGTTMNYFYVKQFPVLPSTTFTERLLDQIVPRYLELVFTSNDMQPYYADIVEENSAWDTRTGAQRGTPWKWNPSRRSCIRAELDAIYAQLYGVSRDELRYILDPEDLMGNSYPSQTFRGLREKEVKLYGEYRTRRLVLEAWDKLESGAP